MLADGSDGARSVARPGAAVVPWGPLVGRSVRIGVQRSFPASEAPVTRFARLFDSDPLPCVGVIKRSGTGALHLRRKAQREGHRHRRSLLR